MKQIEKNIIKRYNQQFPNSKLTLSDYEYERFDAYNNYCVVEVKHRHTWYNKQLIEFDKFSYNSWFAHINNKKFLYVVSYRNEIIIFNITDLNKKKYNFNLHGYYVEEYCDILSSKAKSFEEFKKERGKI